MMALTNEEDTKHSLGGEENSMNCRIKPLPKDCSINVSANEHSLQTFPT